MKVRDITRFLDESVPPAYQEKYDNCGLQVGTGDKDITSALLTIDVTPEVITEAYATGCGLVISHHPLIFNPLKKLTGDDSVSLAVMEAVRKDIAIYSAHTNLDIVANGVSRKMAEKLYLKNVMVLSPLENALVKLVTFIPESHLEKVREAIFTAGAGVIGNYDSCSFTAEGTGTFRGNENTNPFAGEKGKLHSEKEVRFETILPAVLKEKVIKALISSHPYEEVAYDIYNLGNTFNLAGLGCTGDLPEPMQGVDFLLKVASVFGSKGVRYSAIPDKQVSRVALCGGAGAGIIGAALRSGADAFITGDIKYHDFFRAEGKILLADIGHFESEKFTTEILYDLIIKKFPTFALRFSETNTNPINYL